MFTLMLTQHSPLVHALCQVLTSSVASQWTIASCSGTGGGQLESGSLAGALTPLSSSVFQQLGGLQASQPLHNSGFSSSGLHINQDTKMQESSGTVEKLMSLALSPLSTLSTFLGNPVEPSLEPSHHPNHVPPWVLLAV